MALVIAQRVQIHYAEVNISAISSSAKNQQFGQNCGRGDPGFKRPLEVPSGLGVPQDSPQPSLKSSLAPYAALPARAAAPAIINALYKSIQVRVAGAQVITTLRSLGPTRASFHCLQGVRGVRDNGKHPLLQHASTAGEFLCWPERKSKAVCMIAWLLWLCRPALVWRKECVFDCS